MFLLIQVLSVWILGTEKYFLKTSFHYAQVPFKAGLSVFETRITNGIYKLMDNFPLTPVSAGSLLHTSSLFRKNAVFDIGVL